MDDVEKRDPRGQQFSKHHATNTSQRSPREAARAKVNNDSPRELDLECHARKGRLIVLVKAIRPRGRTYVECRVSTVRRARIIRSQLEPVCHRRYAMAKRSGTVSGKHCVKEPQTTHQPIEVALAQFEEWHPSHMKTGLRNRHVGKRVSVRVRNKP